MIKFLGKNNNCSDSGEMMIFYFWCPCRSNHLHLHSVFWSAWVRVMSHFLRPDADWMRKSFMCHLWMPLPLKPTHPFCRKKRTIKDYDRLIKRMAARWTKEPSFFSLGGFNRSPFMLNYICELINTTFDCCWILSECSDAKARRRSGWKLHSLSEI